MLQASDTTLVAIAEGLFDWTDANKYVLQTGCAPVLVSTQYLVKSMGLQVTETNGDIVADLSLDPSKHILHGLLVVARELQRWGIIGRTTAFAIESGMPRKKNQMSAIAYSYQDLQQTYKGLARCCLYISVLNASILSTAHTAKVKPIGEAYRGTQDSSFTGCHQKSLHFIACHAPD